MAKDAAKMEKIVALCKRRGFIFQSSEIYGGINGFWDYGSLGVELKRNIKDAWWNDMVQHPPVGPHGKEISMVGVDCSIIMNPKVWVASGHATGFADPMVDCKETQNRYRADQILIAKQRTDTGTNQMYAFVMADEETYTRAYRLLAKYMKASLPLGSDVHETFLLDIPIAEYHRIIGPHAKEPGTLTPPRSFNLMFKTYVGAMEDASSTACLRPETAQGIFVNFKNVLDSTRVKIPFGIAQIGKAFRNEINPRNYTFRSREFEQMEIEFFCRGTEGQSHEGTNGITDMQWWVWWRDVRINWYKSLGLAGENLRPRNQDEKELAHYSKACTDIEYCFPFADEPQELEGVAHRGCFDLTQHQQHSGRDMTYFDDETKERYVPTVIEPSAGADRSTLAFICEAYTVDESRPSPELLKFHPRLAPIKAAVFPLVNKDGLPEIAEPLFRDIRKRWPAQYDAKQSIGKRYARMDEAGTPYCFTIDGQTKEDGTLTVRDRDTGAQERIDKSRVVEYLRDRLER